MKLSNIWIGLLATFIISFTFVVVVYWDIAISPNEYLLSVKNDGFANYYSFLYHIKYDTSFLKFSGMNYPYGEHIPFVDCQPVVSNSLQWFSNLIFDISSWSVGILNSMLLFSIVLCAVFLYLVLSHYKVDILVASMASVGISLLSSQTLLWEYGHYGLAYSWFFPAGWYFLIKYLQSSRKIYWSVIISVNIIFWFYIHNYLGFMLLLFTLLFHLIQVIVYSKTESGKLKNYFCILIQILIPFLLVYFVSFGLDIHTGRIDMPFTTEHRATWQMIFLPNFSLLKPIYELVFDFSVSSSLTWTKVGNYIGFVTNISLISALIFLISLVLKKKFEKIKNTFSCEMNIFFISAICLLFYAMLFPAQELYAMVFDFVPKLKQFVAIGRFAWVFYYVGSVYAIYFLWNLLKYKKTGKWLLVLFCILTIAEGWSNHYHLFEVTGTTANIFQFPDNNFQTDEIKQKIKFEKYQAVLPLPFIHQYNTPGSFTGSDKSNQFSMQLSYSSGLPLISAFLSRPSISEGRSITELFSPAYYSKKIQMNFHNKKPLLIVFSKEDLRDCEKDILNKSSVIINHPNYIIAELSYDSLFSRGENKQIYDQFENKKSALFHLKKTGFLVTDSINQILYESFDNVKSLKIFHGKGAYSAEKVKEKIIYRSIAGELIPGVEYSMSFWYYSHLYDQSFVSIWIKEINNEGQAVDSVFFDPVNSFTNDNSWYFNDYHFKIKNKENRICITSIGKNYYDKIFYLDELMIRPVNVDVYKEIVTNSADVKVLFKNNEYIKDNN